MTLSESILATELKSLEPTAVELEAAQRLVDAYGSYCAGASSNGIPISPTAIETGKAAMLPVLTGMSQEDQGIAKIVTAMQTFWVAIIALPPTTIFVGATLVVPPTLVGLQALMAITTETNKTKSLDDAMAALATDIHNQTSGPPGGAGTGLVTFVTPVFPII